MKAPLSFGEWLHKQRRALDLSRQHLADQAGCAEITLRRIEAGTLKPSKELASILLRKVGVPQNELEQWIRFARGQADLPSLEQSVSETKPHTNLPALLTSFIGREKEQAEVVSLLTKHRLVTLIGPGGVGKTRLSLKVGERQLAGFVNGIWLVELAPLNNPELIPQTIASIFGMTSTSNVPLTEALINYFRAKTALLILDNCEHILDACAQLTDTLLKHCPNLKIIATSREALGILGEASYPVPSLGVPDTEKPLDSYREFESVRLFEERAQLARFDFSLTMQNASSVAQICHRLDGIPLAIELAAVHVNQFSPSEIATQLNDSFKILIGGNRTALPRHQTLRASIDWSWDLLTDAEQTLMRQLSVFSGGWSLDAALEVCDGDVMGLTGSLVRKSLIVMNQEGRREIRYGFHEVIRQYALEKLSDSDESARTRDKHLDYFIEFADPFSDQLYIGRKKKWIDLFELENDNLRSALRWGVEHHPLKAVKLISCLGSFWLAQGYFAEGQAWCDFALSSVNNLPHDGGDVDHAKALGYLVAATLSNNQGRHSLARVHIEKAIPLFQKSGDTKNLARSLIVLGTASGFSGDMERAFQPVHESIRISREMQHKPELAWGLEMLSMMTLEARGQAAEKEVDVYKRELVSILKEINHSWGSTYGKEFLARRAFARGDLETARKYANEVLTDLQESGAALVATNYKSEMAHALRRVGNLAEAIPLYRETILAYQDFGHRGAIAHQLECFDYIAVGQERGERAVKLLSAANALRERVNSRRTPQEQTEYEKQMTNLRAGSEEESFTRDWNEGYAMTMEQAIEFALEKNNE